MKLILFWNLIIVHTLNLQFVDLRWGITDEAVNQQLSTQICYDEIKKCQKESIGPSFVVLEAQKK